MRSLALALLVLVPFSARVATSDPRPAVDGELDEHMQAFKSNLKTIAKGLQDPSQRDAILAATVDFQNHAQRAKLLEPANLADVPEDERDEHVLAFRKTMMDLQRSLLDLEEKLLDGDADGAIDLVRGQLFEQRNAAHDRFQ